MRKFFLVIATLALSSCGMSEKASVDEEKEYPESLFTLGEMATVELEIPDDTWQKILSKGIGQAIWKAIEALHPEVEVWEACTPCFVRRNIHFYINRLGFHAVEFFNEYHPDPSMPEQFNQDDGLFKFEKRMK